MQLLVSVTCGDEAIAALSGGADVIDAKDPSAGALGAVTPEAFGAIRAALPHDVVVSAALGDAVGPAEIEGLAAELAAHGASFVKVGFANVADATGVAELLERVVRGCERACAASGVVAVAYADASRVGAVDARALSRVAADVGARGLLVDTADKGGASLTELWTTARLAEWVAEAHELGLGASVAGKLTLDDFAVVRESGADIVGVRGAACVGGRMGRVSADLVRVLSRRAKRGIDHRVVAGDGDP